MCLVGYFASQQANSNWNIVLHIWTVSFFEIVLCQQLLI